MAGPGLESAFEESVHLLEAAERTRWPPLNSFTLPTMAAVRLLGVSGLDATRILCHYIIFAAGHGYGNFVVPALISVANSPVLLTACRVTHITLAFPDSPVARCEIKSLSLALPFFKSQLMAAGLY